MATIATFTVGRHAFPIGSILDTFPEARIEIEQLVPTGEAVKPYFWVEGPASEQVREVLWDSDHVDNMVVVDTINGRSLLRCDCPSSGTMLLPAITEAEVALLSAVGTGPGWTVTIRGADRAAIAEFDDHCRDLGVRITVTDIHDLDPGQTGPSELTAAQEAALVAAYERGYYDEPRRCTLEDIASELDISRQALSNRLRRAYGSLIESHVMDAVESHGYIK